jgi:hypothetical protein
MKISPGNAQILSHLCLSHLHHHLPCKFGALEILASSPDDNAYYALPVRQASALPAASFRCNLAVVIFAVRLMVPLTGPIGRLALLSICAMPGAPIKKDRKPNFRSLPVEPQRIELWSREDEPTPSTCLVDFNCRVQQGRQQPNYTLVTKS